MARNAMAIAYDACTGCHSCEVSCKMEHKIPVGQWGIKVTEYGPWEYGEGKWNYDCIPAPTKQCDQCAGRLARGKKPACVHNCYTGCMLFGPADEIMGQIAAEEQKFGREANYAIYLMKSIG